MNEVLNVDSITFGKYKDKNLADVLRDRKYCEWLLQQDWFETNYEYLFNRVTEYDPKVYFLTECKNDESFLTNYQYFNLVPIEELSINLTDVEKFCYSFYLQTIADLKSKIIEKLANGDSNHYDIKAPSKWLIGFETESGLKRAVFKEFINAYELPNLPYIVEDIKREGGIEYKGARSFIIAKARSDAQEAYWEIMLKDKYGEDLSVQFVYNKCIFDFINVSTQTIFECKLGLKDFDEDQYNKYLMTLENFKIVYIVGYDCVVHIKNKIMYTTDRMKYIKYQLNIPIMKNPGKFDEMIQSYSIMEIEDLSVLFGFKNSTTHE